MGVRAENGRRWTSDRLVLCGGRASEAATIIYVHTTKMAFEIPLATRPVVLGSEYVHVRGVVAYNMTRPDTDREG